MIVIELDKKVNFLAVIFKHVWNVISTWIGPHGIKNGFLLTIMFKSFVVELQNDKEGTRNDIITTKILGGI